MSAQKTEAKTRQHTHELTIAAAPEEVWKAITDAAELVNWFPLQAAVEPGKGGTITYGWGDLSGDCKIVEWTPPRHLRTSWLTHNTPAGEGGEPLVVDWFLEGDHGKTRLRLVHAGFGVESTWDDEYEGTRRGWDFELLALKHYLERHRRKSRVAFWLRHAVSAKPSQVWPKLVSPTGLIRVEDADSLKPGDAVRLHLSSGDLIVGRVLQNEPEAEFGFSAENLNHGLLRAGFEKCFGQFEAHLWVALWDYPPQQTEALKLRLEKALADRLVGL